MCHQHWPEIGSEGFGQVDTEQNTDFLQIVMKHLHWDTKQEGAFVVVEVDGGHLHDQQRPNDMSKTVPQARKVFLKLPDVVLLRCVHTSQVLLGSGDQFSTGFRFPDHHPYRMM